MGWLQSPITAIAREVGLVPNRVIKVLKAFTRHIVVQSPD